MTTLAPRHTSAAWSFTGTHWLTSTGAAGSYADAATSAAARVVFPSASIGAFTFAAWLYDPWGGSGYGPFFGDIADNGPALQAYFDGAYEVDVGDSASAFVATIGGPAPAAASWQHFALTCDGTTLTLYVDGSASGTPATVTATYAAANDFLAIRDNSSGRIRSPAIWSSALSGAAVSALYALGVAGDPRTIGGGPAHWWPADGDAGTTITDRGSAGTCNLTLHGGVTIGS